MPRDDSELITACLAGKESAWKELVDRYGRLVYSVAVRHGLSGLDADDVFQNVFTIVYRRLATLRDQKLLIAWLIQITYYECLHQRQKNPNHAELLETLSADQPPLEEEVELMERRHLVRRAIDLLEAPYRDVLTALFLETPTPNYEEVAQRLGRPLGSIGPIRARSFKKLLMILQKMDVSLDFAGFAQRSKLESTPKPEVFSG